MENQQIILVSQTPHPAPCYEQRIECFDSSGAGVVIINHYQYPAQAQALAPVHHVYFNNVLVQQAPPAFQTFQQLEAVPAYPAREACSGREDCLCGPCSRERRKKAKRAAKEYKALAEMNLAAAQFEAAVAARAGRRDSTEGEDYAPPTVQYPSPSERSASEFPYHMGYAYVAVGTFALVFLGMLMSAIAMAAHR